MPTFRTHVILAVGDGSKLSDSHTRAQSKSLENAQLPNFHAFTTRKYASFIAKLVLLCAHVLCCFYHALACAHGDVTFIAPESCCKHTEGSVRYH
jgi:hypothetical protein